VLLLAALTAIAAASPVPAQAAGPPALRHVWVINEENGSVCRNPAIAPEYEPLGETGCPTPQFSAPYLAKVLPAEGTLVENYFGIGHESLDNYIAEVSGQAPSPDTQADCPAPGDLTPGTADAPQQQAIGQGCYFPARVKTIADQLQARGLTWKGYEEDMGRDQAKDATSPSANGPGTVARSGADCSFSNSETGTDAYLAKHNPFEWFHSLTDNPTSCDAHVVPLTGLRSDLQRIDTTPNLSVISPNMGDDGHDTEQLLPNTDMSSWAAYWVRLIMASPAYRQDGMIIIVFDENGDSGLAGAPANGNIPSSCCGEVPGPNSPSPGAFGSTGGGETGAWIVTPYGTPGTVTATNSYNHYSLLRSLEDVFGITNGGADGQGHLGYAAGDGVAPNSVVRFRSFGCDDIFTTTCPSMAGQVAAQASPTPSSNVGPRRSNGSVKWLNPSPQGNDLNGISCATATSCVAVGASGTIISTGDGGSSWSSRSSGTGSDLNGVSCPPGSQLCVAVGAGGAALGSSDGGQTWSAEPSGTQQDLNGVSCPSASVCYAVGANGAIVSTRDGGASWSAQSSNTAHDLAQIACPDATDCYATGDFGLIPASGAPVLGQPARVAGDILVTSDGGSTWSSEAPYRFAARYRGIACTDVKDCVVADEGGIPYGTQDGFQSTTAGSGEFNRLFGASCAGGGNCVLVGERGAIIQTSNGSESGSQELPGGADLLSVSCPAASACYAVGRHGVIVRSTDGGATWTSGGRDVAASNLGTNFGNNGAFGGATIGSLDLAGASCPTATSCVAVGSLGAILTSADGGRSWSARGGLGAPGPDPFDLPPEGGSPAKLPESPEAHPLDAVSCGGAGTCVAVGELGKIETTSNLDSGGGTWSARKSNTPNRLTAVSCPSGSRTCFAVGDYGTILKSTDSGSSWSSQAVKGGFHDSFLNGVSCADASHCVAVGVHGIVLATNSGKSWASVASPTQAYLSAVSCGSRSSCLAVGSNGTVLATKNGGSKWSVQTAPSGDDLYGASCPTTTNCIVTGSDGTIASTADGGASWKIAGTGTTDGLHGVSCAPQGACYAAGDYGSLLKATPRLELLSAAHLSATRHHSVTKRHREKKRHHRKHHHEHGHHGKKHHH
jgi:phosphatidylinositol-3-phosphatase